MALTPERLRDALRAVRFPGFNRDIVRLGMVTDLAIEGGTVRVHLRPGTDKPEVLRQLAADVERVLGAEPGVGKVEIRLASEGRGKDPFAERAALPGVGHVVAVASAKGGVGKSTVAVNLALALARLGRVGLLDADVYGPSLPIMFGTAERPHATAAKRIQPVERHGIRLISMGFFLDEQSPVIWRGPLVMGIVRQFLRDVDWGPTDFLVVDLPPGTGDAQLTLVQQVPVTGGVIVTTPQDVALLDVGRTMAMFAQVSTPVLGVVENMSGYVCPRCGTEDPLFGSGGADGLAERFRVPLLARIPLVPAVREGGDSGHPIAVAAPAARSAAACRTRTAPRPGSTCAPRHVAFTPVRCSPPAPRRGSERSKFAGCAAVAFTALLPLSIWGALRAGTLPTARTSHTHEKDRCRHRRRGQLRQQPAAGHRVLPRPRPGHRRAPRRPHARRGRRVPRERHRGRVRLRRRRAQGRAAARRGGDGAAQQRAAALSEAAPLVGRRADGPGARRHL